MEIVSFPHFMWSWLFVLQSFHSEVFKAKFWIQNVHLNPDRFPHLPDSFVSTWMIQVELQFANDNLDQQLTRLFCLSYYKHKYSYWSKRGVKGPKAYPILGTYLEETRLPADQTEFKFYKEYGSVFGTYYNTQPVCFWYPSRFFRLFFNSEEFKFAYRSFSPRCSTRPIRNISNSLWTIFTPFQTSARSSLTMTICQSRL